MEMNDVDVDGDGELSYGELAQALRMLKVKKVKMSAEIAKNLYTFNDGVPDINEDWLGASLHTDKTVTVQNNYTCGWLGASPSAHSGFLADVVRSD
eukprot:174665-Prorocentrum_minimum.AAC.2